MFVKATVINRAAAAGCPLIAATSFVMLHILFIYENSLDSKNHTSDLGQNRLLFAMRQGGIFF